jgi:DNA-binding response OmpR family regulator
MNVIYISQDYEKYKSFPILDDPINLQHHYNYQLENLHERKPDTVIIDLSNSLVTVKRVRRKLPLIPLLIHANHIEEDQVVELLSLGVDALIKSHHSKDRIFAQLNNTFNKYKRLLKSQESNDLKLQIDSEKNEIHLAGVKYSVTPLEMSILKFLDENSEKLVKKSVLYKALWNNETQNNFTLNTHIYNLKKKVPPLKYLIQTKKGLGYVFTRERKNLP